MRELKEGDLIHVPSAVPLYLGEKKYDKTSGISFIDLREVTYTEKSLRGIFVEYSKENSELCLIMCDGKTWYTSKHNIYLLEGE